jgi:hypothetical protein
VLNLPNVIHELISAQIFRLGIDLVLNPTSEVRVVFASSKMPDQENEKTTVPGA